MEIIIESTSSQIGARLQRAAQEVGSSPALLAAICQRLEGANWAEFEGRWCVEYNAWAIHTDE